MVTWIRPWLVCTISRPIRKLQSNNCRKLSLDRRGSAGQWLITLRFEVDNADCCRARWFNLDLLINSNNEWRQHVHWWTLRQITSRLDLSNLCRSRTIKKQAHSLGDKHRSEKTKENFMPKSVVISSSSGPKSVDLHPSNIFNLLPCENFTTVNVKVYSAFSLGVLCLLKGRLAPRAFHWRL